MVHCGPCGVLWGPVWVMWSQLGVTWSPPRGHMGPSAADGVKGGPVGVMWGPPWGTPPICSMMQRYNGYPAPNMLQDAAL